MDGGLYATWGGIASCGVSAIMFLISRHEGRKAKDLEAARPVNGVSDVFQLASLIPLLIAVRGKTGSDEPVHAEITGTPAVLAEVTEELSALKQNDKGDWLPDSQVIRRQKWETNWFLTDTSKARIGVEGSLGAELLRGAMLITAQEYREGSRSMYSRILDRLTGYRPLGVRKTERVLPVDSLVTVVGELAQSADEGASKFVIRRPQATSGPFYITPQTLTELHASLSRVASTCKWLAVGFGMVGLLLLGSQAYKRCRAAMRYRQIRKQLLEDERRRRLAQGQGQGGEGDGNTRDEDDRGTCIVCWENRCDAVFIPCGHLCVCLRCSMELNRCPVCRKRSTVHRVYQS